MEIQLARQIDVGTYATLGRAAQAWLQSRGLGQYVPAAHDEYAPAILARVAAGTLYTVLDGGALVGFFSLDPVPSPWWPTDNVPALYLAGMVVAREVRGKGIGGQIIQWCVAEARRRTCLSVRLDCHADNLWLCKYYEAHGFTLQGRVEQHPGYIGCLYQRAVDVGGRVAGDQGLRDVMLPLRLASPADLPRLRDLIAQSVRALSVGYYTAAQIESALRHVFGPDTQLISDRTYYVIESEAGELVAAGGWSRRRTLYGGDQMKETEDLLLDPTTEAARIRAFFVHPAWVRRGLGRQLFERCEADAVQAGFRSMELMATLPGEPLYCALGFAQVERSVVSLPDGELLPVVRMSRPLLVSPRSER